MDIGGKAETCAQLFYVEERICKLENNSLEIKRLHWKRDMLMIHTNNLI